MLNVCIGLGQHPLPRDMRKREKMLKKKEESVRKSEDNGRTEVKQWVIRAKIKARKSVRRMYWCLEEGYNFGRGGGVWFLDRYLGPWNAVPGRIPVLSRMPKTMPRMAPIMRRTARQMSRLHTQVGHLLIIVPLLKFFQVIFLSENLGIRAKNTDFEIGKAAGRLLQRGVPSSA
jgi:hypothetical protein